MTLVDTKDRPRGVGPVLPVSDPIKLGKLVKATTNAKPRSDHTFQLSSRLDDIAS
jgi:hypothetical protein